MLDAGGSGDDQVGREAQKQSVGDDAGPGGQPISQLRGGLDRTKCGEQDKVVLIGREWSTVGPGANLDARAQRLQETNLRTPTEPHDFHRQGTAAPEAGRELALIHHDDFTAARLSHDLLPQQGPSVPFDQIERGIDLVRSIDRNVHLPAPFQLSSRNAPLPGFPLHGERSGDPHHVLKLAGPEQLTQSPNREDAGGPGAKSHHHSRADQIHRAFGRLLLVTRGLGRHLIRHR